MAKWQQIKYDTQNTHKHRKIKKGEMHDKMRDPQHNKKYTVQIYT